MGASTFAAARPARLGADIRREELRASRFTRAGTVCYMAAHMELAPTSPVRPRALFLLDRDRLDDIYGPEEWQEIATLVRLVAPPQAPSAVESMPALLREVEILFTGPGTRRIDAALLAHAPALRAIFHADEPVAGAFAPAVWERGVIVVGGLNAEGRRLGQLMVRELRRHLAGEPLRWAVAAVGTAEKKITPLPAAAPPPRERQAAAPATPAGAQAAPAETRWQRLRRRPLFLVVSVLLHLVFFGGATYYVVATAAPPRKVAFQFAPGPVTDTRPAVEHRVQVARQKKLAAAPPPALKRLSVAGPANIALPEMPDLGSLEPTARQPGAMSGGGAGFGQGTGTGSGADGPGGKMGGGPGGVAVPISFFGIRDAGQSVVIMVDVSDSMFTRTGDASGRKLLKRGAEQSFQTVRDEAGRLIQALPPGTRFGIVRWSGGAYAWQPALVPASPENKTAALAHLATGVDMKTAGPKAGRPGGTRHDYALEAAFALQPEIIYMLTDGNATAALPGGGLSPIPPEDIWQAAAAGQKVLGKPARLHVIYYLTGADKDDERKMLRTLATRNGGKFRDVKAANRKP